MAEEYDSQVSGLQRDLIEFYSENYVYISLSSVDESYTAKASEFYVKPPTQAFELLELLRKKSGKTGTTVKNYKEMFFRDDEYYRNVYVRAKPGVGKTSFCKHLSAAWCQAHQPAESSAKRFDDEDIEAMMHYRLAFFITLKEVDQEFCDVDKMIEGFIQSNLTVNLNSDFLERILKEEKCLVVLDGLDEWMHPDTCTRPHTAFDIPHRRMHKNYIIVTTTRSWRLDIIELEPKQKDRHIMINVLDDTTSEQVVKNAVNVLNNIYGTKMDVEKFFQIMATVNLGEIRYIPYIKLQCVCLWFDGEKIGESRCQIYTNILELTLSRGKRKFKKQFTERIENLPASFDEKVNCIKHSKLLMTLGEMAFNAIFNKEGKQFLVMDINFAEKYLNQDQLIYCLSLGLLSRNKEYGHASRRVSYVEFQHRTVHEFFCALFMYEMLNKKSSDDLVRVFSSLENVLKASTVLMFLGGMNAQLLGNLFETLAKPISTDKAYQKYRQIFCEWKSDAPYETIFSFQTMLKDCALEVKSNGQEVPLLPLEDIFVNERSKQAEYLGPLQTLVHKNIRKIKSLSLDECDITEELPRVVETLNLRSLRNLVKLEIGVVVKPEIGVVVSEQHLQELIKESSDSLESLSLEFTTLLENDYTFGMTKLSDDCTDIILKMSKLQSVRLGGIFLSHDQWQNIVSFVTSRTEMTSVNLQEIVCRDHMKTCPGCMMDFSQHENIIFLGLDWVPITDIHIKPSCLEELDIGRLPNKLVLSCLGQLEGSQNLRKVLCTALQEDDVAAFMKTIPKLEQLEELYIYDSDLSDSKLNLTSSMKKLNYIQLNEVTMSCSAFHDLTDTVSLPEQSITVCLANCTVSPENEYQTMKKNIKENEKLSVILDGLDEDKDKVFKFQTFKEKEIN